MEQSELLLVVGAIIIFGLVSSSVNLHVQQNSEAVYGQQAELFAIGIAQGYIEEAKLKAFDERSINTQVAGPSAFSNALSPEAPETYPLFDDVDDYNGFTATRTDFGTMTVAVTVGYVSLANLDSVVTTKTYYKKMTVTVDSNYLNHAVTAEYVFAYQKN